MTAQEYNTAGYRVSTLVPQPEITRAENDVKAAYIAKLTTDDTTTTAKAAIMQLVFILLCQRNTSATRSGGKLKLSPQLSENAQARQSDYDNADRLLRQLQSEPHGIAGNIAQMVDDICLIYMRNFLSM